MAGELEEGGLGMKSIADNLVDRIWTEENGREPFTVIKNFHDIVLYSTMGKNEDIYTTAYFYAF